MFIAHKWVMVFFAMLLVTTSAFAQTATNWDGIWSGFWSNQASTRIVISGGKVTEYWYQQKQEPGVLETTIAGNILTFKVRQAVITMGRTGPATASAQYSTASQQATASLTRQ